MTSEQVWLAATASVGPVVALVALLVASRARRRAVGAEASAAGLAARIALLESGGRPPVDRAQTPAREDVEAFVITGVDTREPVARPVAQPIDGRLFADIVARESVVKAAAWTHGVRRALSPETRDRIRSAVRHETRRAGRERRAEVKQALREFRARERAAARGDLGEDVA